MKRVVAWIQTHKRISVIGVLILIFLPLISKLIHPVNTHLITEVKREHLVNTLLINGTYTIASQTQVYSPTNGVITDVYVTNKQEVMKGDPLFHVESSASPAEQKAAYANLLAAQSALKTDNATLYSLQSAMYSAWDTYHELATNSKYQNGDKSPNETNRVLPEFTTAQDDWLAAEAHYKNQQSVIVKDQAAVASAAQIYNQTKNVTVTAPANGQIINLTARTNDQVTVQQLQTQAAEVSSPVLVIADFSNPVLVASVDQVNIPRLHPGQKAEIVFDALPDETLHGTITSIDTSGTKAQGTVNFNVYFHVQNIPSVIRPNMTAAITIETARKDNILTIPNEAIIEKDNKTYVQKANSDKEHLTEVTLGLKGLIKTEITSGLKEGDKILEQQ